LKRAEQQFLSALAEDEDFPLVYYNLGVVYTELHGLAVTGGRRIEAKTRLSAAETSFGRAIERDPTRWEAYFAFAQTQFRYSRWDSVIELCDYIDRQVRRDPAGEAKTLDLWARALMGRFEDHGRTEDYVEAIEKSREASRRSLRALARSRRHSVPTPRGEDSSESRCAELAAGCLLTFSDIYSRQMPAADSLTSSWGRRRVRQARIRANAAALAELAPISQGRAQVRFDFGRRLLELGHLEDAEEELAAAVQSDPTRPSYAAGLALARAKLATRGERKVTVSERDEIDGLCLRALQGMAGAFFPSRDPDACRIVADVYWCLSSSSDDDAQTAAQLLQIADDVDAELDRNVHGVSVSSVFLEILQRSGIGLAMKVGDYGKAAQNARFWLTRGRELSAERKRPKAQIAFQEALACAESATSLNPLSTLAWETLGDIHRELLDFQNARIAWKHALTTDPDNPRLYDRIGSSYWHIAFQGRARASRRDLERAAKLFERALLLYGSGSFKEQELTHYRLGKLYASLRDFPKARRHIEIVEAVQKYPPLVGWRELGFAYLESHSFWECEYFLRRVVSEGDRLAKRQHVLPDELIGDRLDEQHWPFALIRAWGHLGLAITFAERDGNLKDARKHVDDADRLLKELDLDPLDAASDERFPTRAPAAVLECRGLILLREGKADEALDPLEASVSSFPHSRAYYELGLALEQRALTHPAKREADHARAQRLFRHGLILSRATEPPPEVSAAMERLARASGNGVPATLF
jgi:tetratricopeptide (TPR) repeat protein